MNYSFPAGEHHLYTVNLLNWKSFGHFHGNSASEIILGMRQKLSDKLIMIVMIIDNNNIIFVQFSSVNSPCYLYG